MDFRVDGIVWLAVRDLLKIVVPVVIVIAFVMAVLVASLTH